MPTYQTGARASYYPRATETSMVRDVADRIALLQPEASPLVTFMNSLKRKKEAINSKYEWLEDELVGQQIEADAGTTTVTLTITAGSTQTVRNGDILIAPNGEAMRVTSGEGTTTLTVVRDLGATGSTHSVVDGDKLVIAGSAFSEGVTAPTYRWVAKAPKYNLIQIFRDPVLITDSQDASESIGGNDRVYQRKKVAIEHKRGIETALLLGARYESTNLRTTGGLSYFVTTNVTDFGGTITEAEFEVFLRTLFRYQPATSPATKVCFAAPIFISAVNFWAKNALQVRSDEKTYGMRIATYRSGHGDLDIIRHWLLMDFDNFDDRIFCVDPSNLSYRHLRGLDTKLHVDIADKTYDYKLDEYRSYVGFQCELEKTHAIGKGITGFAA